MRAIELNEPPAPVRMGSRLLRDLKLDGPLLLLLVSICGIGLVVLYSAAGGGGSLLLRQGIRLAAGFVALIVIAQIPPRYLRMWAPWLFLASCALLCAVLVTGDIGKGARRWLDLGFVRFQPSELAKLTLPLMVAWYLHDRPLPPRLMTLPVLFLLVAAPAVLIGLEPDLGTALLVLAAGAIAIMLSGLSLTIILGLLGLGLAAAPVLWHFMLPYQRRRVETFLNPESDPLGAGYNIIQSKIAIGSGGPFGKGWMNGTQAQLEFLPERSTDFIFAVMGEEFGLLGLLTLLILYLILIGRGLYIAAQAHDTFGRLVGGTISLTFFVYVFVNAGMVCGLLPVVGIPLPLVSAGGTSMVTLMAGFGILTAIANDRKLLAS